MKLWRILPAGLLLLLLIYLGSSLLLDKSEGTECHENLDIIEKTICETPKLKEVEAGLETDYKQIASEIKNPEILRDFQAQHEFWLRERNNLRNSENPKQLAQDLITIMTKRSRDLLHIKSDQSWIEKNASEFSYVDPWYLEKYRSHYIGKKIHIYGKLSIPDTRYPHKGLLSGIGDDRTSLFVLFRKMPAESMNFILANEPVSHHEGLVRKYNDQILIYMDSLLGNEL